MPDRHAARVGGLSGRAEETDAIIIVCGTVHICYLRAVACHLRYSRPDFVKDPNWEDPSTAHVTIKRYIEVHT